MSTPALVNASTLDDLNDTIGAERLNRLVDRYAQALAEAFSGEGRQAADLGREAHTLVSMAGMLGCDAFCETCRGLENLAKQGADLADPLAAARRLRDDTLAALAEWRGARVVSGA